MKVFVATQQEVEIPDNLVEDKEIEDFIEHELGLSGTAEWKWDVKSVI